MPKLELDKETQKLLNEHEKIAEFTKSEAWHTIKGKLVHYMAKIDSLTEIPEGLDPDQMFMEMKIRHGAISLVQQWLKEIEGISNQSEYLKDAMYKVREETIVQFFPN